MSHGQIRENQVLVGLLLLGLTHYNPDKNAQNDHHYNPNDNHELHVFPPHLALQLLPGLLELVRADLQRVRALIEVLNLGVALQDLVDVVAHDPHHLIHLILRLVDLVSSGHYLLVLVYQLQ